MSKLFSHDNPIINLLGRITDMMILNLLTLLLCVPVITAGAAITANYYSCLKIKRDEDSGILKMYFRSFKENFRQSTILFFIVLAILAIPSYMLYVVQNMYVDAAPIYIRIMLSAAVLLAAFLTTMVFPVQSRFSNTVFNTLKTSMLLAFSNPFRTLLILVVTVAPIYLTWNFLVLLPAMLLFGVSVPAFIAVLLYNKAFLKMEKAANEAMGIPEPGSEDEHIFGEHDDSEIM